MQILDVKALDKEELEKRFEHLFNINAKEKGGTLYLQSKVWLFSSLVDVDHFRSIALKSGLTLKLLFWKEELKRKRRKSKSSNRRMHQLLI